MSRRTLILLLLLLVLLVTARSSAAFKQRRRQRRSGAVSTTVNVGGEDSLDTSFPRHLRSGFAACNADSSDGELGLCKLLAAFDTQLELLGAASSPNASSTTPPARTLSDSCRYRSDGGDRLHTLATSPSPHFADLLQRYQRLHEACTAAEHGRVAPDVAAIGQLRCRYVVWRCTYGLGNRIMSLVSTFLYALLTQRVLLLDIGPSWDGLFCPAFLGSPWRLAQGVTFKDHSSPAFSSFIGRKLRKTPSIVAIALDHGSTAAEHGLLACPSSMAAVRDVPIMFFKNGNQYFATGFFLNPSLRPVLETIFPDHRVFHTIARSLLFPSNEVWASIAAVYRRDLQPAARRLGVQLRESKGEYRDFYDASVRRCIRSQLCPIETDEFQSRLKTEDVDNDDGFFSVYVSSLAGGHAVSINGSLTTMEAETGQKFKVVTIGSEGRQKADLVHLQRALVDMWSLSLSDTLLTSPMSTFGYVAQGLAGITPLQVRHWKNNPCLPSVSSEPCYHFAPARNGSLLELVCVKDDNDGSVENTKSFSVEVPDFVKACPDMPGTGMQLSEPW